MKRLAAALLVVQILALIRAFGGFPAVGTAVGASPSQAHDRALKSLILRAEPRLRSALAKHDNHRAAAILLHWVAPRVAWSLDKPAQTKGLSAGDIYFDWFRHGTRGVFCDGAADFFQKTLKLFGVPSVKIDFGRRDIYTHVTVLVPSTARGKGRNYEMFDPTFGARLVWAKSGHALPFGMGLELVRDGAANFIGARTVNLSGRPLVRDAQAAGRCAGRRAPSCGLAYLDTDPRLAGHGEGAAGLLTLYARGRVFTSTPRLSNWFLPGARRQVAGEPTSNDT